MPELPLVLRAVQTTFMSIAFLMNSAVFLLISGHKNTFMKTYARLLLASTTVDICQGLVILLTQPVILIDSGMTVTHFNGYTGWLPESVNWVLFGCVFLLFNATFACSEVQFFCRYVLICHSANLGRAVRLLVPPVTGVVLFLAVGFAWIMKLTPNTMPSALNVLRSAGWPFDEAHPPQVFGADFSNFGTIFMASLASVHFNFGFCLIMWCEYKVYNYIRRIQTDIQTRASRTHQEVHRALIIMALTPLVAVVIPLSAHIAFGVIAGEKSPAIFLAILTDFAGLQLLVNPVITVIFIRPYRLTVLRLIRRALTPKHWCKERLNIRRSTITFIS